MEHTACMARILLACVPSPVFHVDERAAGLCSPDERAATEEEEPIVESAALCGEG